MTNFVNPLSDVIIYYYPQGSLVYMTSTKNDLDDYKSLIWDEVKAGEQKPSLENLKILRTNVELEMIKKEKIQQLTTNMHIKLTKVLISETYETDCTQIKANANSIKSQIDSSVKVEDIDLINISMDT